MATLRLISRSLYCEETLTPPVPNSVGLTESDLAATRVKRLLEGSQKEAPSS
jgi:hypothetical protein